MLKDHKSAMHLEGVTFDKVIRNSNEAEEFLNFLLFYNCQLEIMCIIHLGYVAVYGQGAPCRGFL